MERRTIRLLDDTVINKIAAGEVVERPASVVKELLENALDAGASQLDIELVEGGRKLISIADDGCGMTRDQALLSVERHATSKIRAVEDIEEIATMGFRGEALSAIPSVSRFSMKTRVADEVGGTEIVIHGGKMIDVKDAGCPPGTTIEVRNLFCNVPARRKFLRSPQTELAHIRQLVLMYALAFPEVGITLVSDGRTLHQLTAGGSMDERLHQLFDRHLVDSLRPVDYRVDAIHVSGFAADPRSHRGDRTGQYMFINRRPASAPLLGYAINHAYEQLLPKGRYPVVFLFLEVPPQRVDVNVHPAKKEVRFRQPQQIRDTVMEAIRRGLRKPQQQKEHTETANEPDAPAEEPARSVRPGGLLELEMQEPRPKAHPMDLPYPRLGPLDRSPEARMPSPVTPKRESQPEQQPESAPVRENVPEEPMVAGGENSPWGRFRVLGRVGGKYVVLETSDGLVLLDPQAAHERVVFEQLVSAFDRKKVQSQGLLTPETVSMPPADALLVRKHLGLFQDMGFGISDFGGDTFMVDALPVCFGEVAAAEILREVATGLERGGCRKGAGKWTAETVARAACRSAVHSGRTLTMPEIERLVNDLAAAEMPYTCPHGRPTVIFMSFNELDRKFGRK
jgi:DNA mismatch repair protein MutL